ncbi:ABC transporter permease subunit [Halalkalibacter urbisdiaboli]|uniref:ABC transporter permease subunit n=1 Tax=Halalkalibacter urbisdiaboli TaxID=1960589 RepID=UPI000B43BA85|nr:ABC transporter permease subunit [Halalkalibacter urbisdiaboli]
MNLTLYKQMMKASTKSILGYGIGSGLYILMVISIFPSFADSAEFHQLLDLYPESLLAAFGIEGLSELSDFLAGQYYGMIYLLLLSIFTITTSTKLIARFVSQGSMAFLLAIPISRKQLALTQSAVLLSGIFLITFISYLFTWLGQLLFLEKLALQTGPFLMMNIVGILLFVSISSYCFLFSTIFSDDKKAIGYSASVTVLLYSLDLLGRLSDKFEFMRSLTFFSLFNPSGIAKGEEEWLVSILIYLISSVILYTIAIYHFIRRDLPL